MKHFIVIAACALCLAACSETQSGPSQVSASAAEFQQAIAQPGLVLVDFNATWCGPCRQMAPLVAQAEKDYAGKIKILSIDVDQNQGLAQQYGVSSIPNFVVLKAGKVIDQRVGGMSSGDFRRWIDGFVAAEK